MRHQARRWRAPSVMAAALVTALAACGASSTSTHASAPTRVVHVRPVTAAGAPVAGYRTTATAHANCEPGSEAIGQAYRCFAGNTVYDPCWPERAATAELLCLPYPWSRTDVKLTVSSSLPSVPNEGGIGEPWGVQLSGGQRCFTLQGAHSLFHGRAVDYECGPTLFLLRGLDKSARVWLADSVMDKSGHMMPGPVEKIAIAWFGSPAKFH